MKLLIKTKFLFTACLIAVLLVICGQAVLSAFYLPNAFAEEETLTQTTKFHESKIEEDLLALGINTSVFAKNEDAKASVLNVTEYCYSTNTEIASTYYNLYFYVYNPTGKEIIQSSNNVVQLDIAFDGNGEPVENGWEHHIISICDYTDNLLFYKFKLLYHAPVLKFANSYAYYNDGARKYSISGITLTYKDAETGEFKQIESTVATSFTYTGFSKGCGSEPESTLECGSLDTISLNINDTTWRSNYYDDNFETDSISTVIFGLPERYLEEYKKLKKIKAEWYEYKTKPIFVTSDEGFVEEMKKYVGKDIDNLKSPPQWAVLYNSNKYSNPYHDDLYKFSRLYNIAWRTYPYNFYAYGLEEDCEFLSTMYYLFERPNVNNRGDYKLSPEELEQYMKKYTAGEYNFDENGKLIVDSEGNPIPKENLDATGQFSMDLFLDKKVDSGREYGYNLVELDAEEDFWEIEEQNKQKWWEWLFRINETFTVKVNPIEVIDEIPENMSIKQFEDEYKVDDSYGEEREDGTKSILQDCKDMLAKGLFPVLFRFANTKYCASTARFDKLDRSLSLGPGGSNNISSEDGYVAQETVFLNFDILTLTFQKDNGEEVIIPVVSDPTNIIAGLIPPLDLDIPTKDIWALLKLILGLILLVIILIVFWPFISPVLSAIIKFILAGFKLLFKLVVKIVTIPIRLIKSLFGG